jgi:3'-phosphoadenosine 5'-phosphosulfate sulfotransferase (PAPS reductase)/FAD synthetase
VSRVLVVDPAPCMTAPDAPGPDVAGWLSWWDLVVVQTSAGKDSQTAMRAAVLALNTAGLLHLAVAMHMDLGGRVEWPKVPELAAEQATRNGLTLAIPRREGVDLLDDVATRRKRDGGVRGWPGAGLRYCTSDHKTAPSRRAIEAMCEHIRDTRSLGRPVRVLQVMGFRAGESKRRAELAPFSFNARQSASTKRHVFDWLPIQGLTTAQVWADIRTSGVPYHPAYDEGMSRLSCRFCVLASSRDLSIARRLSPEVADEYIAVEREIGHTFQNGRALASVQPEPGREGFVVRWTACPACGVRVLARDWETDRHCPAHADTGPWDRHHDDPGDTPGCGQLPLFVSTWGAS